MTRILFAFILLLSLSSCGGDEREKKIKELESLRAERDALDEQIATLEDELAVGGKEEKVSRIRKVTIRPLELQSFAHFIEVQGKVDADENVAVSPRIAGTVTAVYVAPGSPVTKGQILAQLDAEVLLQGIEEVKNQLDFAKTVFEKQENLWKQEIGTEIQYLSAKNNKEALERKLVTLQGQYGMTQIKSPIGGVVDEVLIKPGQAIMPGMPAVRVVNLSRTKLVAEVSESYVSKIRRGNKAIIYFPDIKQEINSTITFTGSSINPINRTFTVEASLSEGRMRFSPNMLAVLKIKDYDIPSTIVVPINLIQNSDQGQFVFVASKENGKVIARKRMVELGSSYRGSAQIVSGLNAGDLLVVTDYQNLNEGEVIAL